MREKIGKLQRRLLPCVIALAAVLLCLFVLPTEAEAATASGTCGTNVTWTLDEEGTLTISGSGAMNNYSVTNVPWKYYRDDIKNLIIENGVTSIGDCAFFGCTSLTGIWVKDGNAKFSNDEYGVLFNKNKTMLIQAPGAITTYTIPNCVTSIGSDAFIGCTSLTSITIPDSVTSIGDYAFLYCTSLTSIDIPDSVTSIGDYAFADCTSLTSIDIPDSVTSIGEGAFEYCYSLTDVYYGGTQRQWNAIAIGNDNECLTNATLHIAKNVAWALDEEGTLTIYGNGAMKDYTKTNAPWASYRSSIKKIVVESGITYIGNYAFYNCTKATEVSIANSVTTIGKDAFENCTGLTEIEIPDSVTSIGAYAFKSCTGLTGAKLGKNSAIGDGVFWLCSNLTTVVFPENITVIPYGTFYYCSSLENVTVPEGVETIGQYAFYRCDGMPVITLPGSVTNIEARAFIYCFSLKNVYFTGTMDDWNAITIGGSNTNLTKSRLRILVASGTCGENAVWKLDDEGMLTIYGSGAMNNFSSSNAPWASYRTSIRNVVVEEGITAIGNHAFNNCTNLTSVTIGNTVKSIGRHAFYICGSLDEVHYGATLEQWNALSIGNYNSNLTSAQLYTAKALLASGTCGTNAKWKLDVDGLLTVYGTGAIKCYTKDEVPWASYRSVIKQIVIEASITRIGDYAFYGCTEATEVTLADTVIAIGNYSFENCTSLTEFTMPTSVTSIAAYSFKGCTGLKDVTVSRYVTKMGDGIFWGCSNLTYVTMPVNIPSIPYGTFYYCSNLKSLTIPNTATSIGGYAFYRCTSLKSIDIPSSVTEIADRAFIYASGLKDVYFEGTQEQWNAVNIGSKSNTTLTGAKLHFVIASGTCGTDVTWKLEENGTLIISGEGGISGYTAASVPWASYRSSIKKIVVEEGVTRIGNYAFYGCTAATEVSIANSVTFIGNSAFENCTSLASVTVPDSVTSIGEGAFKGCTNLVSAKLSKNAVLGKSIFWNCTSLANVTLPENMTSIPYGMFYYCSKLESLTVPEGVTTIGGYAFYRAGLKSIEIPASVTTIEARAFIYANSLKDVYYAGAKNQWDAITIGGSNTTLTGAKLHTAGIAGTCGENLTWLLSEDGTLTISGSGAMSNFTKTESPWLEYRADIQKVVIEAGVTTIGNYAFYDCTNLTEVEITGSVTAIGKDAFENCTSLTEIEIPDSVTSIGAYAFKNCTNLVSAKLSKNATIGDGIFWLCSNLTTVTLPENIASIPYGMFYYCAKLQNVTVPSSVKTIGEYAFYRCETLKSINIPFGVNTIGKCAFIYCYGLKDVYYSGFQVQWDAITIGASNTYLTNATIHVIEPDVTGIAIKTQPTKKQYWIGENLNTAGLTLTATYSDGITRTVSSGFTVSGFSSGAAGTKTVTVAFEGFTATFTVEVVCGGTCGENLTWILDDEGTLIISGTGDMWGYSSDCPLWYNYRSNIKNVIIENGVTSIGDWAFSNCDSLTSVTIGNSVTSIGSNAFYNCSSLTSVALPDSVTSIGDYAFCQCYSLTSVTIGNSVTSIGNDAFFNCVSLTSIVIPDSVTSIGDFAFWQCYNLTSVVIPDSVTSIGYGVFCQCDSLTTITIPNSVTSIDSGAFSYCDNLTSIVIPDSVTSIREYAFDGCNGLTTVYYGGTQAQWDVITIGDYNDCLKNANIIVTPEMELPGAPI